MSFPARKLNTSLLRYFWSGEVERLVKIVVSIKKSIYLVSVMRISSKYQECRLSRPSCSMIKDSRFPKLGPVDMIQTKCMKRLALDQEKDGIFKFNL